LNFGLNWRVLKTFLQIYAETNKDRDPLDVSILPANEALILAALGLRWPRVRGNEKWRKRFFVYQISDSLTQIIQDYPEAPPGVEEDRNHTRRLYCLPSGIPTCYPRSVNRNIFYIIGVIVVIVIVLKVLHVF
jgi:hypothetical protein